MSTQKTVQHADKALRKGFTVVPNALLLDPKMSAGALRVYAVFTHLAWAPESEWPGQDEIGPRFLGVRDAKTVRKFIGELTELGLLNVMRRGRGLTNLYEVHLPAGPADSKNGKISRSRTGENDPPERENSTSPIEEEENKEDTPIPPKSNVVKFRGRQVPLDVYCTGVALLDSFNAKAGTGYSALTGAGAPSENLKRIFGALLDHPEISLEIGERMIALAFAKPFWHGTPQTGVVFGPGVCEGNVEAAMKASTAPHGRAGRSIIERLDDRREAA